MLERHDGRGVATRGLAGVDGNIDPLQDATYDGGKACRRGRAVCVGARAGKGTAAGADERLDHGRGRSAQGHGVVGSTHKGRHAGGCLNHDSQGSRPASSREYAGIFRDIHAIAVERLDTIDQPSDGLREFTLLESEDTAVAGTERRDRGAIDGSLSGVVVGAAAQWNKFDLDISWTRSGSLPNGMERESGRTLLRLNIRY